MLLIMPSPELTTIINDHADVVYQAVGQKYARPETIHTLGFCGEVTPALGVRLLAYNGIRSANRRACDLTLRHKRLRYHEHLVLSPELGALVVDATWQQFLLSIDRTPELPKVLIGTPDEVIGVAVEAGVFANDANKLWSPR